MGYQFPLPISWCFVGALRVLKLRYKMQLHVHLLHVLVNVSIMIHVLTFYVYKDVGACE